MQIIENKNCPQCDVPMINHANEVWLCRNCKYTEAIEIDADDMEYDVKALFYQPAIESFYPLLSHEYKVLMEYVENKNYFGALLQYKDVAEIILKFPVLIAINHLWRKNDDEYSDKEREIIEKLLGTYSGLSLGDWKELCERFISLYTKTKKNRKADSKERNLAENLEPLLSAVKKLYEEGEEKIVTWRNNNIGHGALRSDLNNTIGFMEEFEEKFNILKRHFIENHAKYEKIVVCGMDGRPLLGWDSEKNLDDTVLIEIGDETYEQYPFILVKVTESDRTTDLFDSYSISKNEVYILNYAKYGRAVHTGDLVDLFAERGKIYFSEKKLMQETVGVASTSIHSSEIDNLSSGADEKSSFESPQYIINDIKNFMDTKKNPKGKGVMFLQMERGMGKTTLMRALDQLGMWKENIGGKNDTVVRAYYINSTFYYQIERFENQLLRMSVIDHRTPNARFDTSINLNLTDNVEKDDLPNKFVEFLRRLLLEVYSEMKAKRFLFIIDGLDEIKQEEAGKGSILDCIPASDQLSEGVYILLTGRPIEEVSAWMKEPYTALEEKSDLIMRYYAFNNKSNIDTLINYIKNQKYGKNHKDELLPEEQGLIKTILDKGKYRFLHVKALLALLRAKSFDINAIDDNNIIQGYLDVLEQQYGNGKYYGHIQKLLLIIAMIDEPASIEELAYLCNSAEPTTMRFIGFLADLKGLLNINRTGTTNESISISHEDWKKYLTNQSQAQEKQLQNTVKSIFAEWIEALKQRAENGRIYEDSLSGESYLVASLWGLVVECCPELKRKLYNETVLKYMSDIARKIIIDISKEKLTRAIKIYTNIIDIVVNSSSDHNATTKSILANSYKQRGSCFDDIKEFANAIADYSNCINIIYNFIAEGISVNMNELASVYNNRGVSYKGMLNFEKALKDYNFCIDIQDNLLKKGELLDIDDLAIVYIDRGILHLDQYKHNLALSDLNKGIDMLESLNNKGTSALSIFRLGVAYMNRGNIHGNLSEYESALNDFDNSISIMNELLLDGKIDCNIMLAKTYMNRGNIFTEKKEIANALSDYNSSMTVYEDLESKGKLVDKMDKAYLLINRGVLYETIDEHEKSIDDLTASISILEKLFHEGKLFDISLLTTAYMNRGNSYRSLNEYELATANYDYCIYLLIERGNDESIGNEEFMAKLHMNKGACYYLLTDYENAIKEYSNYISIIENISYNGKPFDFGALASAYMSRGIFYKEIKDMNEAKCNMVNSLQTMKIVIEANCILHEQYFDYLNRTIAHIVNECNSEGINELLTEFVLPLFKIKMTEKGTAQFHNILNNLKNIGYVFKTK